jgi:hypothetical protein
MSPCGVAPGVNARDRREWVATRPTSLEIKNEFSFLAFALGYTYD